MSGAGRSRRGRGVTNPNSHTNPNSNAGRGRANNIQLQSFYLISSNDIYLINCLSLTGFSSTFTNST